MEGAENRKGGGRSVLFKHRQGPTLTLRETEWDKANSNPLERLRRLDVFYLEHSVKLPD